MSMIERVARAICQAGIGPGKPSELDLMEVEEFWRDFIPEARAAIEAMREIDPDALWSFAIGPHHKHVSPCGLEQMRAETLEEGWHAMIDVALAEGA